MNCSVAYHFFKKKLQKYSRIYPYLMLYVYEGDILWCVGREGGGIFWGYSLNINRTENLRGLCISTTLKDNSIKLQRRKNNFLLTLTRHRWCAKSQWNATIQSTHNTNVFSFYTWLHVSAKLRAMIKPQYICNVFSWCKKNSSKQQL